MPFSFLEVVGGQEKISSDCGESIQQEFEVRSAEIFRFRALFPTTRDLVPRLSDITGELTPRLLELNETWEKWTQDLRPQIMPELQGSYSPFALIMNGVSWFCVNYEGRDERTDEREGKWLQAVDLVLTKFDSSRSKWVEFSRVLSPDLVHSLSSDFKVAAMGDSVYVVLSGGTARASSNSYSMVVFNKVTSESGDISGELVQVNLQTNKKERWKIPSVCVVEL